jgi:hypothetical protein
MNAGAVIVIVIGIVATVAVVGWFFFRRNDPEDAATHAGSGRSGSAQHHGGVDDRPAGPGAEADGVADRGEPVPGPSAEGEPTV